MVIEQPSVIQLTCKTLRADKNLRADVHNNDNNIRVTVLAYITIQNRWCLGEMCSSRKIPTSPTEGFWFRNPSSPRKLQLIVLYFSSKRLAFKPPSP